MPGAQAAPTDNVYLLGPDSAPHPGVPQGIVIGPATLASRVFPDTTRHYWVYVPAQYDPAKPACLMIFQDGHAFVSLTGDYRIPYVFDNLIYRREMPVTIGVFINPGHLPDQQESSAADWGDRINNRRIEYNALNDNYSKLITDELLPVITKEYNISPDPSDRAIAGASSGAICAFTVAWQRPDQFRKVISTIGSFTDIMGGHVYPDLVRKSEPKPIRIFLQDGVNDNRGRRRGSNSYDPNWDWHAQNIKMVQALTERKYDVNYTWGIGTHSNKQGGAIMPGMLRWLWRDYPRPDDPQDESNRNLFVPPNRQVEAENGDSSRYAAEGHEVALHGSALNPAKPRRRGVVRPGAGKPVRSHFCHSLEGAGFFKKVCGAGDQAQFFRTAHLVECLLVHSDHGCVVPADDQQGRGFHLRQRGSGQIRAASARDDGADRDFRFCLGHQGRAAAGARSEVAQAELRLFPMHPNSRAQEALGQELDIKPQMPGVAFLLLFVFRQEIKEQRPEAALPQGARDILVARAMPAAATAVGEKHDPWCARRDNEFPAQFKSWKRNGNVRLHMFFEIGHTLLSGGPKPGSISCPCLRARQNRCAGQGMRRGGRP